MLHVLQENHPKVVENKENNKEIFVMKSVGYIRKRLTNNPANDYNPVWSPDGTKIAFIRDSNKLIVMDAEGNSEDIIAREQIIDGPCWSPDGKYIIFTSLMRDFKSHIMKLCFQAKIEFGESI